MRAKPFFLELSVGIIGGISNSNFHCTSIRKQLRSNIVKYENINKDNLHECKATNYHFKKRYFHVKKRSEK